MILTLVLLLGCALWALGELIMVVSREITVVGGTLVALGMTLAGAGVFALKDLGQMAKPGRVGIVLSAFGAFSFAMVMVIILTSGVLGAMAEGAVRHADMVFTPFYLLALVFAVGGLAAFAVHFSKAGDRAMAGLAAVLALLHLGRLFAADFGAYHELASIGLALYLGWLGIVRLAIRR